MGVRSQPITLAEFLAWEAAQEERHEFDGIQPVAMTGATRAHARVVRQLILAVATRLGRGCEAFGGDLKVVSDSAVRYPDALIACAGAAGDTAEQPSVAFEVLSASTALTDRRIKPLDYSAVPGIQVDVMLEQDRPAAPVLRRARGWLEEALEGRDAPLALPEVGIELRQGDLHPE